MNDSLYINLIDNIFNNKKYPYFAAERRIDSIFSIFIEDILRHKLGKPIGLVNQEFPIKIEKNNQAKCVDFLCTSLIDNDIYFVELKTDINSVDYDQLDFYLQNLDWDNNIKNLKIKINSRGMLSDYKIKYFYLMDSLVRNNLIEYKSHMETNKIKDDIIRFDNVGDKANRTRTIKKFLDLIIVPEKKIKVICIAPSRIDIKRCIPINVKLITFNELSNVKVTKFQNEWEYLLGYLITL